VSVGEDGKLSGELTVRTSGLFVSEETLRTEDAQRRRVRDIVHHVLPAADVKNLQVQTLGGGEFFATVDVTSDKLDQLGERYKLMLAEQGPASVDISLPLDTSVRKTPLHIPGAFDEVVEIAISWPADWTVEAQPMSVEKANSPDVMFEQTAELGDHKLTLRRHLRATGSEITPEGLRCLYSPLNTLRTLAGRTLILAP